MFGSCNREWSGAYGAAATNATLAWLGGGTLTSGGFGVAGGTIVLGTIATAPAILIAGWYIGAKASENLNNAKSNQILANKFANDAKIAVKLTKNIKHLAETLYDILGQLRNRSSQDKIDLEQQIEKEGFDYRHYTPEGKEIVGKGVKTIQLLIALVNTPILDEHGNILGDAETNINSLGQLVTNIQ